MLRLVYPGVNNLSLLGRGHGSVELSVPKASGVAWSPLALTSPLIWNEAAKETGYANSDPVASITNFVPSGPAFTQGTTVSKPTFIASGINSLPSFRFDGVDDGADLTGLGAQSAWSLALVFRQNGVDGGENSIFSVASYPSATNYKMFEKVGGADGTAGLSVNANPIGASKAGAYSADTVVAVIITANGSAMNIYDDAGNTGTRAGNHARADDLMQIARRGDGNFTPMDYAVGIFTGAVMTSDEIAAVFTYFNSKWGTAIP